MTISETPQRLDAWYPPKEIAKMPGMPTTVQGVHKRAKRERWNFRRRSGIRGPAIEYNLTERLPLSQKKASLSSGQQRELFEPEDAFELMWSLAFRQCSETEKKALVKQLTQHGMSSFLLKESKYWLEMSRWFEQLPKSAIKDFLKIFSEDVQAEFPLFEETISN